jgi:hypothetical protein
MDKKDVLELIELRAKLGKHIAALARIDAKLCPLLSKLTGDCHASGLIDDETVSAARASKDGGGN